MKKLLMAALAISLAAFMPACDDDDDATGGTGGAGTTADAGGQDEDVGTGGNTGGGGDVECHTHNDCGSGEICEVGSCQNMYDRVYEITIISAVISEEKPNGDDWDWPGGKPDPYARLLVDGESVFRTHTVSDDRRPEWYSMGEARIFASSDVVVRLVDEDISDHDNIDDLDFRDFGTIIKNGGYSGSVNSASVEEIVFTVVPK